MKRWMLLSLITSGLAFAADFSGKWAGTLATRNRPVPLSDAHFVTLEQKGDTVTGMAGPKRDVQWPLRNAKVNGTKINFMVEVAGGELLIEYSLELKDNELSGTVEAKNREGVSWNLRLTREP
jgi:hypothetical protein